jgi:hypothetical protein
VYARAYVLSIPATGNYFFEKIFGRFPTGDFRRLNLAILGRTVFVALVYTFTLKKEEDIKRPIYTFLSHLEVRMKAFDPTWAVDGKFWVLIGKVEEHTGYSDDAIRAKKNRGIWKEGIHWRKGPDNRVIFDLVAIQRWLGGRNA